jgi:hypothetical protein
MTELSDVFRQQLDTEIQNQSPASAPSRRTAREAVRQCLGDIRRGRKKQVPWDAIAESIQSSAQSAWGISVSLTGETAKRYYYQFTAKKKRKKRSRSNSKASRKSNAPAPATAPAQPVTPATTPAPEPVARSPAPKPEPEPEVIPVVDEPVTPETSQAESTEELHPNRFRDRFKKVKNPKTTTGYENCKTL